MTNERFNDHSKVLSYVLSCPLHERSDDCPAQSLRDTYGRDWLAVVSGMSDEEARQLVECHRACVKERGEASTNNNQAEHQDS